MLIREAMEADAMGIAMVVKECGVRPVAEIADEEILNRIAQGLSEVAKHGTSLVLVGTEDDGTIAGYCSVHWVPFLFFPGGEGYITELFVRPRGRSNGLGSWLLREVEARARQRGCFRLSLLNGRDGESYKRNFYARRRWVERELMANFVRPLQP